MAIFSKVNKNNILNKIKYIEKAYTEGVYADSPLNRKLGRVGMSYKKYEEMVAAGEKEKAPSYERNYIKNEIPENISDLNFKKNEYGHYEANYKVGNKDISIYMVIHGRDDRSYSFTIKEGDKKDRYQNLSTKEVTNKMKDLKRIEDNIPLYDKVPLTPEELNEKWGDIGFNYTFYKDNLDLKVWIREDSDKKNPRLNLYIIDRESGKKKSKTNLSLAEIHDELLKYELNPKIDVPMNKDQLKEYQRLKNETTLGKDYKNSPNYISHLLEDYDLIDKKDNIKHSNIKIDNYNVEIIPTGKFISLSVSKGNGIQEKVITINNNKHDLSIELDKIEEGNYPLLDKNAIQPSKDIGVDFNKDGIAYFKDNNYLIEYRVNKENKSDIDIVLYDKNGKLIGVDSTTVDNFKNKVKNLNLFTDKDKQVKFNNTLKVDSKIAPKELIENYSSVDTLISIPNIINSKESFDVENFNQDLVRKGLVNNKWNKEKRNVYAWVKSGAIKRWLRDLPPSNKKDTLKEDIYQKMIKEIERFSPSGETKYSRGVENTKKEILKEYY